MVDRRLLARINVEMRETGQSRSAVMNRLMWAGVLNGPSFPEKCDFFTKMEELAKVAKDLWDKDLD